MAVCLVLAAGMLASWAGPARARRAQARAVMGAMDAEVAGRGRMRLVLRGPSEGRFDVAVQHLARAATYDVLIDGVRVAALATNRGGNGMVRFRTRPRGRDRFLGFDPRGATVVVRDADGNDVLAGTLPGDDGVSSADGAFVCCIPDDDEVECVGRTEAECAGEGGAVIAGASSCLPDPCGPAGPADRVVVCCLPDDEGEPECEQETPVECLAAGGTVVEAGSCADHPCGGSRVDGEDDEDDHGDGCDDGHGRRDRPGRDGHDD